MSCGRLLVKIVYQDVDLVVKRGNVGFADFTPPPPHKGGHLRHAGSSVVRRARIICGTHPGIICGIPPLTFIKQERGIVQNIF